MARGFAALSILVVLAFAPAAQGATVKLVFDGTAPDTGEAAGYNQYHVEFVAKPGEINQLTAAADPYSISVHDDSAVLAAGTGCSIGATSHDVTCKPVQGIVSGSTFDLGDGNDTASLDQYWDTPLMRVQGGAGNDDVTGPVTFDGGTGADRLTGLPNAPVAVMDYSLRTEALNVSLDGVANDGAAGEGDFAGSYVGHVEGGSAGDVLTSDDRGAFLVGNGGDDMLVGAGGNDQLFGKEGNDTLRGGPGADSLYGDGGDDSLDAGAVGAESAVTIPQNGGQMNGGEGNDFLTGNALGERITGGNGDDSIDAGDGPDVIDDGYGRDVVRAGAGDDFLDAGFGPDVYSGGDGRDRLVYTERIGDLRVSLDDVADDGETGEGDSAGADLEDLTGSRGNDFLVGNAAANSISGGVTGTDSIDGRGGPDTLVGTGHAMLVGGPGQDVFSVQRGDRVRARDGEVDSVTCVVTRPDDLQVDQGDRLSGCAAPVRLSSRVRIAPRDRIAVTVACGAPSTAGSCRGHFKVVLANGDVVARSLYVVKPGKSKRLSLKISARTRAVLRRARKPKKASFVLLREGASAQESRPLTLLPRARR